MIDLRYSELPSELYADGRWYPIYTGFRTWIEFDRSLRAENVAWYGIFKEDVPQGSDWVTSAIEFLASPNDMPRSVSAQESDLAIDYIKDGELIVAAFQQAYGIDLTTTDMHWHRFKALLFNVPEDTRLSKVMGYRTWRKQGKESYDEIMRQLKEEWRIVPPEEERERAQMLQWMEQFGTE